MVSRLNYGVIFKPDSNIILAQENWLHTFHVVMPKRVRLTKMPSCSASQCEMLNNFATIVHSLHEEVMNEFNLTVKTIRDLIPETSFKSNKRKQRSLLPFIGSLSKSLFGTATLDDVNILASHINALNRETNKIAVALKQHGEHLSSFITIADKRMNNLMKGIKTNSMAISTMSEMVNKKFLNIEQAYMNMSRIIVQQVSKASTLRDTFNKLESSVQTLVENRLTPYLIPKSSLIKTIQHIHRLLRKNYKQFYLTHTDPAFYYSHAKFVYARVKSSLYITVKFPVSTHNKPLELYKVISLPVPLVANTTSHMHATQLKSLSDYFAITHHRDHYVTLSAKDLVNCQYGLGSTTLCDSNLALTPITSSDCTLALFSNNRMQVHNLCDFRYVPNLLRTDLIEISPTSVLVYNSPNLALNCPKEEKVIPGCKFCIVHVPCRCSLSTNSLYFSPRLVNCYNSSTNYTVVHPVNLALLQQYFGESELNHIFADTTFLRPINMSVPAFQFYNHSFQQIIANDQESHLSLKRMAKAAKQDQKIFKNLAEPLIDGRIDILSTSLTDMNSIITFVSIGIAILCFIMCIFLIVKTRKLALAVMVLQQIPQARSQTIPSFIYKNENVNDQSVKQSASSLEWFSKEFAWDHASVIIASIVLIFTVCNSYINLQIKVMQGFNNCVRVKFRWRLCCCASVAFVIMSILLQNISAID